MVRAALTLPDRFAMMPLQLNAAEVAAAGKPGDDSAANTVFPRPSRVAQREIPHGPE
jgi:hypothetical protein